MTAPAQGGKSKEFSFFANLFAFRFRNELQGCMVKYCLLHRTLSSVKSEALLNFSLGAKMNKNDLIAAVAASQEMTQSQAQDAVDATFATITNALASGEEVRVPGFGVFAVSDRAARTGRNPKTGETIQIAASKQPKLKVAKALKDAVNG
jgi:DNA-binding protein HU-beta